MRLGINPHRVLRATRPRKRPPLDHDPAQLIDLILDPLRLDQLPLRIGRLEDAAVRYLHSHQPVRQVDVRAQPVGRAPALVREHHLREEHVRQRVADRLVDQVDTRAQALQRVQLARGLRLRGADHVDGLVGEDDGAVAIRLEVDADVEVAHGRMVEVLDTGWSADDRQLEDLVDVFSGRTVGVGGLYEADVQFLVEAGAAGHLDEEDGAKGGNAVAVEEVEGFLVIGVVVDDAVGVAVQRAAAFVGAGIGLWGGSLFGLDVVRAALWTY